MSNSQAVQSSTLPLIFTPMFPQQVNMTIVGYVEIKMLEKHICEGLQPWICIKMGTVLLQVLLA